MHDIIPIFTHIFRRLLCKHNYHISALPINDRLLEISSECRFCGKFKKYKINGSALGKTTVGDLIFPTIYLFSTRKDFEERQCRMKEILKELNK